MEVKWVEGYEIRVTIDNGTAIISANREGLLSLATQLVMMATEAPGTHIHYDDHNSLEEGSAEMIIEKSDS